jgi:hypothetical protein
MKLKIILATFVIFLIVTTPVLAESSLQTPRTGDVFNLGDSILITGTMTTSSSVAGANVDVYAYSSELNLRVSILSKFYSFTSDVPVTISQINQGVVSWTIPQDSRSSSDWVIYTNVSKGVQVYSLASSGEFEISRELSLSYGANAYKFNLGESLTITGTVLGAGGNPVDGTAKVSFLETVLGTSSTDFSSISGGYFVYSKEFTSSSDEGSFVITISAEDNNNNSALSGTFPLTVTNDLSLSCTIPTTDIKPGSSVAVTGELKDIHGNLLSDVSVTALITDPASAETLRQEGVTDGNGKYGLDFTLPKLGMAGLYSVRVDASDSNGNEGQCEMSFDLEGARSLKAEQLSLNGSSHYSGDELILGVKIENDGNVDIGGVVKVYFGDEEVHSFDISIERAETKEISETFSLDANLGTHIVKLSIVAQGQILLEKSLDNTVDVLERKEPEKFKLKTTHIISGLVIFLIAYVLIFYWKDARDYLWHRQHKRHLKKH